MQKKAIAQMKEMQTKALPPEPPAWPKPPPSEPPRRTPKPSGLLSRFLHMEIDTALVLPLLLLLSREGADDALLLALLYIMS